MKIMRIATLALAMTVLSVPAMAQSAGPELIEAAVTAYNAQDIGYFQDHLAEDVVWMDEDGHFIVGKQTVLGFIGNQLNATPAATLSVANVRVGSTDDAAWATYAYTIDKGGESIEGLNTTVFRRNGEMWEVVVVHGAINAAGHH